MSSRFFRRILVALVYLNGFAMVAQDARVAEGHELRDLQSLAGAAGSIFTGTVTAVRRVPVSRENELDTVQITFRVAHALRGAQAGRDLAIREWIGLWAAGERYRVGERVLLFLYPPSKLGLTSPVAGRQGRFSVDEKERVILGDGVMGVSGDGTREDIPPSATRRESGSKTRVSYREVFRTLRRGAGE